MRPRWTRHLFQYVTTSDGYNIAYAESGHGRAVVLLPILPNNLQFMWQHQPAFRAFFEAMADRYRFIQYDGRGMGLSSRGLGPNHTLEDRRLDFEAVVERLHLDRICIIAPNAACHVAVPYAINHPERVDGLVLWNPGWNQPETGTLLPYEELVRRSWELFVRTLSKNFGVGDPELDARRLRESVTPEDFVTAVRAVLMCNLRPVLPSLKCRRLFLAFEIRLLSLPPRLFGGGAAGLIRDSRLVAQGAERAGLLESADEDVLERAARVFAVRRPPFFIDHF